MKPLITFTIIILCLVLCGSLDGQTIDSLVPPRDTAINYIKITFAKDVKIPTDKANQAIKRR